MTSMIHRKIVSHKGHMFTFVIELPFRLIEKIIRLRKKKRDRRPSRKKEKKKFSFDFFDMFISWNESID